MKDLGNGGNLSNVSLTKDGKGGCWVLSHVRCGITECLFLTVEELIELRDKIESLLCDKDGGIARAVGNTRASYTSRGKEDCKSMENVGVGEGTGKSVFARSGVPAAREGDVMMGLRYCNGTPVRVLLSAMFIRKT